MEVGKWTGLKEWRLKCGMWRFVLFMDELTSFEGFAAVHQDLSDAVYITYV
jgi:hypothetical protein